MSPALPSSARNEELAPTERTMTATVNYCVVAPPSTSGVRRFSLPIDLPSRGIRSMGRNFIPMAGTRHR
jgi:hypothetical protein